MSLSLAGKPPWAVQDQIRTPMSTWMEPGLRAAPGPSIRLFPLHVFRIEGQSTPTVALSIRLSPFRVFRTEVQSTPTVAPFTRLSLFRVLRTEGQSRCRGGRTKVAESATPLHNSTATYSQAVRYCRIDVAAQQARYLLSMHCLLN